jgi:tetratricopeptide (TPR) repeat protein
MEQKDFKNAENQYLKILDANPKDLEIRAELGDLKMKAGDFKSAEKEYTEIKKQAPKQPLGYVKLSSFYIAQQKTDRAIAEMDQLVKINPTLWPSTNDLAYLLEEYGHGGKDLDRAYVLAQKANSMSPDNPAIFDTLGWILYRKGEMNQALNWLIKAQTKVPGNPVFNYHLGMTYYKTGNAGKAKKCLQVALASKIKFPGKEDAERTMAGIH